GTPLSLIINPLFWALTITYFASRSTFIEQLFPPLVFYIGAFTLAAGNFLLFYQMIMACLHRREYGTVKYVFVAPLWWAFTSYSMWKGISELVLPRLRFTWHVTEHGVEKDGNEERAIRRLEVNQATLVAS